MFAGDDKLSFNAGEVDEGGGFTPMKYEGLSGLHTQV